MSAANGGVAADLRPTVPGRVHGIVSVDPYEVQCDGCARTWSGGMLVILVGKALFNPRLKDDHRRLCKECHADAGWKWER